VLAAVVAGVAVSSRLGPERLRAEIVRRLSAELGPVQIDAVRPHFGWGIGIEIEGLRTAGASEAPELAADRVWITLSARSLLRGEPLARRIDVRGLRVDAVQRADGVWEPPALARLLERWPAQPDAALPVPLPSAAVDLRALAKALPALSVEDAELRLTRHRANRATHLALRDLYLELTHDPLGGAARVGAKGRLLVEESDRGRFEVEATIERKGPYVEVALTDADLGALAPWLAFGELQLEAAGRVSGTASWKPETDGGSLVLDLLGFDVRLAGRLRAGDGDVSAAFPNARLHAKVSVDPRVVRLGDFEWSAEPTKLAGSASLERPFGDGARLAFEVRGGPIAVTALRDLLLAGVPKTGPLYERATALRAGTFESIALRASPTPIAAWRALADAPLDAWPDGLEIETRVAGVTLQLVGSEPLREFGARVRMRRERIEIEAARANIGDRPLPELWLTLSGLRAVAAALAQGEFPPAVPPLPGRIALSDWVDSHRRAGAPPRWRRIDVDAEWLEHPVLLRPIEEFTAQLTPANPGVHVEDAKGFWAGVPFHGRVSFRGGGRGRIDADLTLSLPRREGRLRPQTGVWGRAKFHADLEKLGDFQAEGLDGVVQAIGDRVELRHGAAKLRPRGDLSGIVDLDLSRTDAVPYHARIELVNGSLSELMNDLKMDGGAANGTADIDTELQGLLVAKRNLLSDTTGSAVLRLRKGEILKRMNVLFLIAQASDTLNPFRSRETIPYERIDAPLRLANGIASTDALTLEGPALRLVGTGSVNVVESPHLVEAVIGIFYFRALDRVIGIFPLLNRMLLGPDDNLVSTYFAVSGPWADTRASIIPSKSIASGPGSFVLEGLPSFVRGGISTLERIFTTSGPGAEPKAETAPAIPLAPPAPLSPPSPQSGDLP
jgi:hypothetical protein